ncbi:MAG: hypothetical protein K2Y24_09110 [Pseudomonadaceae bacterium]|nr:hypothetical protein [Pseudomonadaceae bacterium]
MQNLNLFQVVRKRRIGPRPAQMWLGLGIVLLLCGVHADWQLWQLQQSTQRLQTMLAQAERQEAQLEAVRSQFIEPQLDARLPEELSARERDNRPEFNP